MILRHEPKPFPSVQWPAERLRQLEGDYSFDVGKNLSIRADGDQLHISIEGLLRLDLHPSGEKTLLTDREGIWLSFQPGVARPVRRLELHVYGKTRVLERR
jgi:hypothetical protein